jgi:ubiquinone/menaquinone biosynthesis C-methylase UbiE
MTATPFRDGEFDLVVSSLAIHNITGATGRATALNKAVRVLRPGGRLALVDFRHTVTMRASLPPAVSALCLRRRPGTEPRQPPDTATRLSGAVLCDDALCP